MEALYRQALAIREVLYGKDSTELISTLDGLAYTCSFHGEYVAAEALYARLLSLWEKLVGKDHPMIAVILDKIVVLYAKQNKSDEARETWARSVAIRERFLAVGLIGRADQEKSAGPRNDAEGQKDRFTQQRIARRH